MDRIPREGVVVPPRWRIVPAPSAPDARTPGVLDVVIDPGPGFGDGTHPTTALCLQAIGALAPRGRPWTMLDFGSGSGVLSIAAARLGARVVGVEIDDQAISHAARNATLNGVADRVRVVRALADAGGPFDLVVGNILRAVLVGAAGELTARVAPGGTLVLSGLVSTDVPAVAAAYAARLGGARPEVYDRSEWRALVWRGLAS
jgi:ribosomal protein L11 methyltransferase